METIKMKLCRRHKEYRAFSIDSYPPVEWEYIKQIEVEVREKETLYIYRHLKDTYNYITYLHPVCNVDLEFVTKVEIEE